MNCERGELRGSQLPRRHTPPLIEGPPGPCGCGCALTPFTSYGYDVVDFAADVLGLELDPWQRWLMIHAGELLADGRPRFRIVLTIVARQNGKTYVAKPLLLYWMFIEQLGQVLNTSTDRSYAKKLWLSVLDEIKGSPLLSAELGKVRLTSGEETVETVGGAAFTFAANNGRAGRSLTVQRWLCDELREHKGTETWDAAYGAMAAAPYGQVFAITNQGDAEAVKLHALHDSAVTYLETGTGDARLGLFEWSAPDGSSPTDPAALAAANPGLGIRVDIDDLTAEGARAQEAGGEALSAFLVERMCMRVTRSSPAFNLTRWADAARPDGIDLAPWRDRVALCVDVALDSQHATLVAAALDDDGTVLVDVVAAWDGPFATRDAVRELPGWVNKVRPRAIGWFPAGPAATLITTLGERGRAWAPRGTVVETLSGDQTVACMGVADLVATGGLRHGDDPLLTQHVEGCTPAWRGDAWLFQRRGRSSIDAAYAMAGAVHLARTLPPPRAPLTVA